MAVVTSPPEAWIHSINPPTRQWALLMWHSLSPRTRAAYASVVAQWERFCYEYRLPAWPVTPDHLRVWIPLRYSSPCSSVAGATMENYLSALRSHHIDLRLPLDVFDSPEVKRLVRGLKSLNPSTKRKERLPILQPTLGAMLRTERLSRDDYNINAAFTLAFAAFLRLGEITFKPNADTTSLAFVREHVTRSDVMLEEDHLVLRLKRSKTDYEHQGVSITVAASGLDTCPVRHMQLLLSNHRALPTAPLFILSDGTFSRQAISRIIAERLRWGGIDPTGYTGHSFRQGAAQHAANIGMPEAEIRLLGRWQSDAVKRYFKTPQSTLFRLNRRFQTGRDLPLA